MHPPHAATLAGSKAFEIMVRLSLNLYEAYVRLLCAAFVRRCTGIPLRPSVAVVDQRSVGFLSIVALL